MPFPIDNFTTPVTAFIFNTTIADVPWLPSCIQFWGYIMGERRKARRYEVYLPVQVCMSKHRPLEYHTGQLRDVSRTGIFFHSDVPIESGTGLELTFSLPAERERGTSVLVRASAKTLRSTQIPGEVSPSLRRRGSH